MRFPVLMILLGLVSGCASSDSRLYEDGDPGRLKDGTIRVTTQWTPGEEEGADVRVLRARAGKVTCSHISPAHGHFVGEVPEKEWVRLWSRLLAAKPFSRARYKVEPPAAQGGPYHLIRLQLGEKASMFSAQHRANLLGMFSSKDIVRRLELSNAIIKVVSRFATRRLEEALPDVKKEAGAPGPAGDGR